MCLGCGTTAADDLTMSLRCSDLQRAEWVRAMAEMHGHLLGRRSVNNNNNCNNNSRANTSSNKQHTKAANTANALPSTTTTTTTIGHLLDRWLHDRHSNGWGRELSWIRRAGPLGCLLAAAAAALLLLLLHSAAAATAASAAARRHCCCSSCNNAAPSSFSFGRPGRCLEESPGIPRACGAR